jgi:DNA (cytosine-5)-methyltransferase 1
MDPWAVVRWCADLRVKRLLVENVPEFQDWGPIDLRSGRPIRRRKGEYFRAWVEALRGLGFKVEWRLLNAADYGDATTRVRFFLLARSDGKRVHWPEPTHARCLPGQRGGLLGKLPWRAARDIIDWSIEGRSIYDRKRPLAAATLARIHAGIVKFRWPEPYLIVLRRHMAAQSLDLPLPALTAGGGHVALAEPIVEPFLLNRHGDNGAARGHSLDRPMPTADCRGAGYLVEPFTLGIGAAAARRARSASRCRRSRRAAPAMPPGPAAPGRC